jgi:tetratricopeptide (TPR) repeat protein
VTGTAQDAATEALELAEADPAKSMVLAHRAARQARTDRDLVTLSLAERALGLAAMQLEDPGAALSHLRAAIRLGNQAGSAQLAAEARMRLAFALNVRGRGRQALREIEASLLALTGTARAQAQAQRAAILIQLGRIDEALPDCDAALAALRPAGEHVWVQRVLYNRAVLYGYRQQFAAAEADLHEAAGLCRMLRLDLSLGFVHQNLGWIAGLRGDVPTALNYLDLAEQCFRAHGAPVGELLTDRSQLLLSVRLIPEARQAAAAAVAEFELQGRQVGLPEARLLLAQAAILDGQPDDGLKQARAALREFDRQDRARWVTLARWVVLRARLAATRPAASGRASGSGRVAKQPPGVTVTQLERIAADLLDAGWPSSALDARLLAARLALKQGWTSRAGAQLERAARQRRRGPALLRARGWYALALQRDANADHRGATVAARTALRVLDEHRTGLGATDLRAHASGHRVEVAEFGLRMAFDSGRAARVLDWAEQGRASHLMLRPVRPPADPDLSAALSELRAVTSEVRQRRRAGLGTAALVRRQVDLEGRIRDHVRRSPGEPATAPRPVPARTLAGLLGDSALVEFVRLGETLHAVVVCGGRSRLRRLGTAAQAGDLIDRARFALHRLARHNINAAGHAAASALLASAAEQLDALLLRPLARDTGDRPLVVVPTGPLQSLPWPILPSCAGRPVTVAPSATLWCAAQQAPDRGRGHTVLAAGPGLPGAAAEVAAAGAIHHVTPLTGGEATVETVTIALDGARLAHLAAHGHIHPNNPLFSSLSFADGPLTVYDLNRLHKAPRLVILAACDAGRSTVRIGDELLGLSATFLALGTACVVASVVPIPDAETMPLMTVLHQSLAAGLPTSHALAHAQQHLDRTRAPAVAAAAGFLSIGADIRAITQSS